MAITRIVNPIIRRRKNQKNSVVDVHAFANERQHGSGILELTHFLLVHGGKSVGTLDWNRVEKIGWISAEIIDQRIAAEARRLVVVGQGVVRRAVINAERRIIP